MLNIFNIFSDEMMKINKNDKININELTQVFQY